MVSNPFTKWWMTIPEEEKPGLFAIIAIGAGLLMFVLGIIVGMAIASIIY